MIEKTMYNKSAKSMLRRLKYLFQLFAPKNNHDKVN